MRVHFKDFVHVISNLSSYMLVYMFSGENDVSAGVLQFAVGALPALRNERAVVPENLEGDDQNSF